ncbi:MAG: GNAT family N-acetyltransferase [Pseudomonadota bacterium]
MLVLDRAKPGEEAQLALVGSATFLETYAGLLSAADIVAHCAQQHAPSIYRDWLVDKRSTCWLVRAQRGAAPVGYAVLAPASVPIADPDPADLELKRIYLLHRFQRQGMGRRLIDAAAVAAREGGSRRLLIGVYSLNLGALAFYERLGFQRAGERTFRVGASDFFDYLLSLPLQ